jgi:hypothetical protein
MMDKQEFEAIYDKITPTQRKVLKEFLQGKSYTEFSDNEYREKSGFARHISNICTSFRVQNKGNGYTQRDDLVDLFVKHKPELVCSQLSIESAERTGNEILNFIEKPLSFTSIFYVERPPIESECYEKILEDGAFIRIKAPQHTGKTLLLSRIIAHAKVHKYQAVILDFRSASNMVFSDYEKFLKWLCVSVGRYLGLENKLAESWDSEELDEHTNTQIYFEDYLLKNQAEPLILAFKNVDRVFEQESFRIQFCELLRCWSQMHVEGNDFANLWKQLRLIIVHSTNIYGSLDINCSPLKGVGLTKTLLDFTPEQVGYLANCYELDSLKSCQIQQFMKMFGGHPYLVQEAFICLKKEQHSLDQLLEIAATEASPFINHLRQHLEEIGKKPELATAYHQVLTETQPVRLDTNTTFKLQGMGLVLVDKNDCLPRCDLYRQYFSDRLNPN